MCTRLDCTQHVGKWVHFQTAYGYHRGIIERVTANQAIVISPRHYIPTQLASESIDDEQKLDLALVWGGFGGAAARPGYGRYGGGYGGYGFGWARWAVSFLVIYALWGLLVW